jgi:hypothetical protein
MSNVIGVRQERPRAVRAAGSLMLVAIGLAAGLAVGHVPAQTASVSARSVLAGGLGVSDAAYQAYRAGERESVVTASAVPAAVAYQAYRAGERASLVAPAVEALEPAFQAYRAGEREAWGERP